MPAPLPPIERSHVPPPAWDNLLTFPMIYGELDEDLQKYVRGISRALARGDRHLADDLEQETFVAALQGRPRDPRATRAWLRGITRNCLRSLRSRTGRRPRSVAYTPGMHDSSELKPGARHEEFDPSRDLQRSELRHALEIAIERLPESYAEVITLRVVDGLPPRDIAAALEIPVETVRTRTRRGFERLKAEVERLNVDSEALSAPRPLFVLFPFLATPGRRASAATAVALPTLATIMWWSAPDAPASTLPPETGRAGLLQDETTSALAKATVERMAERSNAQLEPEFALADLVISISGAEASEGIPMRLSSPATERVIEWTATDGTEHRFSGLMPGPWSVQGSAGETIATRELEPGPSRWDLALAPGVPIEVQVTLPSGRPASGAMLFQRHGFASKPDHVATADAWGRATIRSTEGNQWIAARGDVGLRSEAILVDQPYVMSERKAELRLQQLQVGWVDVLGTESFEEAVIGISCEPVDQREHCMQSPRGGIRGLATWVPAWHVGGHRFAVVRGNTRKHLCVTADDDVVFTSAQVRRAEPLPATLTIQSAWSINGRLLSSDGQPIDARSVRVTLSERSRMTSKTIVTDEAGRFQINRVTTESVALSCNGRQFATATRPQGGGCVELGDVHHPHASTLISVAGRVVGVSPPFLVHGVTVDDARTPTPVRLATNRTRKYNQISKPDGRFDLQGGPGRILGIMVSPIEGDDSFTATLFKRPITGWPAEDLELEIDPDRPPATIEGSFDPSRLPGIALFEHVETGWRRTLEIEEGDGSFESPPLCAGIWTVSLQDRSGRFAECRRVTLALGQRAQLGPLRQRFGRIELRWPEALAHHPHHASVYVVVTEGSKLVYRTDMTRAEIEGDLSSLEVPAGNYRVGFYTQGAAFMARCKVSDGAAVPANLEHGKASLSLRLPRKKLIEAGGNVRLEARDRDGILLDALDIERNRLADEQRFDLICDRRFPITVLCIAKHGTYRATIESTDRRLRGVVSLNPHQGASFEPAR